MKATFPHMGNLFICIKTLLEELEVDYIVPPFNNKTTLEVGTRYVPECACLPLKITIGTLMQAYNMGADTVLMVGGCGPCRFGYYCEMYREILKDLRCKMEVITLEPPSGDLSGLLKQVRKLTGTLNLYKIAKAVKRAAQVAVKVDELENMIFKIRPRELERGIVSKVYRKFRENAVKANSSTELDKLIEDAKKRLLEIKTRKDISPLKIGIVGEIYTTIDDYTNFNIQHKLGDLTVETHRYVTISNWIIDHIIKKSLKLPVDLRYVKAAKPYLGEMIGGHARETIGNTVLYAEQGYDGVIQIYPFTCMPEIVAESILPAIEKDYDIPILTLIIDEMTGEAGYFTRVEAFTDLLYKRREAKTVSDGYILSGN